MNGDLLGKSIADVLKRVADRTPPVSADALNGIDPLVRAACGLSAGPDEIQVYLDSEVERLHKTYDSLTEQAKGAEDPIVAIAKRGERDYWLKTQAERDALAKHDPNLPTPEPDSDALEALGLGFKKFAADSSKRFVETALAKLQTQNLAPPSAPFSTMGRRETQDRPADYQAPRRTSSIDTHGRGEGQHDDDGDPDSDRMKRMLSFCAGLIDPDEHPEEWESMQAAISRYFQREREAA